MTFLGKVGKPALLFLLAIGIYLWFITQYQKIELNHKIANSPVVNSYVEPDSVNTFFVSKFEINEGCDLTFNTKSYENVSIVNNASKVTLDRKEQPPLIYKSISLGQKKYEKELVDSLYKDKWWLIFNRKNISELYELKNQLERFNWAVEIEGITELKNAYITIKKINIECNFTKQLNLFENGYKKNLEIDITKLNFIDRYILGFDIGKLYLVKNNNVYNIIIILYTLYIIKTKKYYYLYLVGFIVGIYYINPIPIFLYPFAILINFIMGLLIKSKYIQLFIIAGIYLLVTAFYKLPVYSNISYLISILGFIIFTRILVEERS